MTATRTRRRSVLSVETLTALAREKALFIARNNERCRHLLVRFEADESARSLVLTAAFALDETRNWQQVEVSIAAAELHREAGPDMSLIAAFGQLDDGISTARIARLFAPMNVDQRMAAGRA